MGWMERKMGISTLGAVAAVLSALSWSAAPTVAAACDSVDTCRLELTRLRAFDQAQPAERRVAQSLARLARRADRELTRADRGPAARRAARLAHAQRVLDRMTVAAGRAYLDGTLGRESMRVATTAAQLSGFLAAPRAVAAPATYTNNCAVCHGATAQGGIGPKIQCKTGIAGVTRSGTGSMPAFTAAQVSDADIVTIEAWLATFCTTPTTTRPPVATTTTTRPPVATTTTTQPRSGSTSTSVPGVTTTSTTLPAGGGDDDGNDDQGDDDHGRGAGGHHHGGRGPGSGSGAGSGSGTGSGGSTGGTGSGTSATGTPCKQACASAISQCPRGRARRKACKRQLLASCRLDGVQACAVAAQVAR